MTDPKIPAPEPVVEFVGVLRWRIPHAHYVLPYKYLNGHHLFCNAAEVEAYAAALAEKARQEERERLHTLAQQMMDEATEGNWAQAAVIMEQMLRAG
jgi:hypothetical protein